MAFIEISKQGSVKKVEVNAKKIVKIISDNTNLYIDLIFEGGYCFREKFESSSTLNSRLSAIKAAAAE